MEKRRRRREGRTAGVFHRAGKTSALACSGTLTGGFVGLTNVITTRGDDECAGLLLPGAAGAVAAMAA